MKQWNTTQVYERYYCLVWYNECISLDTFLSLHKPRSKWTLYKSTSKMTPFEKIPCITIYKFRSYFITRVSFRSSVQLYIHLFVYRSLRSMCTWCVQGGGPPPPWVAQRHRDPWWHTYRCSPMAPGYICERRAIAKVAWWEIERVRKKQVAYCVLRHCIYVE